MTKKMFSHLHIRVFFFQRRYGYRVERFFSTVNRARRHRNTSKSAKLLDSFMGCFVETRPDRSSAGGRGIVVEAKLCVSKHEMMKVTQKRMQVCKCSECS